MFVDILRSKETVTILPLFWCERSLKTTVLKKSQFAQCQACNIEGLYINNSRNLTQNVRIFVRGHYLFREENSFPRAKLEENCELRGTDNVQGQIYRGYYTVARRYEFYVRRTSEILFLPREHKSHIFEPTCNVLFIIWRNQSTKAKFGNRDVIERYDTHTGDIRKIRHSGPGVWNLRVV